MPAIHARVERKPGRIAAPGDRPQRLCRMIGVLAFFEKLRFALQGEHLPGRGHLLKLLPLLRPSQGASQSAAILGEAPIFSYPSHPSSNR
jgi:hypothetical protein